MKKLIVLLLFIPLVSFGQTFDDALNFLKMHEPMWACERYVKGTFTPRMEISLNQNNSKLIIKQRGDTFSGDILTYNNEIELSKITTIEVENKNSNKPCNGIRIITEKYGISTKITSSNGQIIRTVDEMHNEFYLNRLGNWRNNSIKIKNDNNFDERSKRIIKALKFMAIQNGANLKESYF